MMFAVLYKNALAVPLLKKQTPDANFVQVYEQIFTVAKLLVKASVSSNVSIPTLYHLKS